MPLRRLLLFAALLGTTPAALAVEAGETAPAFALPTAKGETVALDKLKGQVVYVDFWASWCGPCKRSFPWMNDLQQRYGGKGLAIVAVNVDKRREDADKFLAQTPAQFTIVFDPAGGTPTQFAVKGMPSSYLIDGKGNVIAVEQGFHDDRKGPLEDQIRTLLSTR